MENVTDSILLSVEKLLGIDPEYDVFHDDIIMHINAVFLILKQLGVGPSRTFSIASKEDKWSDFFGDNEIIEAVKTYVYMKVRLIFDPPVGSALDAMNNLINEYEWRLMNDYTFEEDSND